MYDEQTVQRFIELRASGWTCARLMTGLNASKPALIAWSPQCRFLIPSDECHGQLQDWSG